MVYEVVILEDAKSDIKEARVYYRKNLPALSKRFTSDTKNVVAKIKSNPLIFGLKFNEFRTANLSVFPYQIHLLLMKKMHG
jgi:hypothetical protein